MRPFYVSKSVYPLFRRFIPNPLRYQRKNNLHKCSPIVIQKRCLTDYYMNYSIPDDPSFLITQHAISDNKQNLALKWQQDNKSDTFHALWLRHQCHCEECLQPSSGHRLLNPANIDIPLNIEEVSLRENLVHMKWRDGKDNIHEGHIPLQWLHLKRSSYFEGQKKENFKLCELDFSEVVDSEKGLYQYLSNLNQHGVVKICNAPEKGAARLAEAISYIHPSVYGVTTFDVFVKPNPDSVAYHSVPLLHHTDLTYYHHQPGLQHLHCVKFDKCVTGGILTLKDIYQIAEDFRKKHSEEFNALATIPTQFDYIMFRNRTYLQIESTNFKLDRNGAIEYIRWGPNFQGAVMSQDPKVLEVYFFAFKKFNTFVESYPIKAEFQFSEGDIASFHNIRMVHGRTGMELNGGCRQLLGCYTPLDEFGSRLRYLSVKLGKQIPKKIW